MDISQKNLNAEVKMSKHGRDFLNSLCVFLALVLLLCSFSGCSKNSGKEDEAYSFEVDKVYERGPLTVHVKVSKTSISIAQTIRLELEASLKQGYEISMPEAGEVLTDFGIVDWQNLGNKLGDNDTIVTTHSYRLEPFLSGKFSIPAFEFEFYDVNAPDESLYHLETEPVEIEVTSLLGEDRANLTIEDIEGVVGMPSRPSYLWLWTIGILLAGCAGAIWFRFRKKKLQKLIRIFKPAHEIAYARLKALVKENLIEAGKIKEFYERISDILRHYIEDRFELHAPERTTEEFLNELAASDSLKESDKKDLALFLEHCDLVKFAKFNPTTEQIQKTFDLTKNFIEKTKSDERTVDVTDDINKQEIFTVGNL